MYALMIVDDEKAIREFLPKAIPFERFGFQVCCCARNGEDALEKLAVFHPDVILLDVSMPVLDGLGFLKRLHEEHKDGGRDDAAENVPYILMLSGYSDFEYARTAMRYGARGYLTKPLEEEEIGRMLLELKDQLDEKQKHRSAVGLKEKLDHLQEMYHAGDGDRSALQDFFLLHCIVLSDTPDCYRVIQSCVQEVLCGEGDAAFFQSQGSIHTFFVSNAVLAGCQYSGKLFARHLLYRLRQVRVDCAVLLDRKIFLYAEGTFRKDYDVHLYQMLTGVFWNEESVCEICKEECTHAKEIEREDVLLSEIRDCAIKGEKIRLREVFLDLMKDAQEKKIDMFSVQELNFRLYYMLLSAMKEESAKAGLSWENETNFLRAMDFRECPHFVCNEEWRDFLWGEIEQTADYFSGLRDLAHNSIGKQAYLYMQEHFREPLSLSDVASNFYVSSAWLGKCIQKENGCSFKQLLTNLRMEKAKRLLAETDLRIYEVAEAVGYQESKYFVKKFIDETGISPLEYRKRKREKIETR